MAGVAGLNSNNDLKECDVIGGSKEPAEAAGNPSGCRTFDLEEMRRDLIVMRNKHGPTSPIGHRCSNLIELIQLPELPQAQYDRQMADLRKFLAQPN